MHEERRDRPPDLQHRRNRYRVGTELNGVPVQSVLADGTTVDGQVVQNAYAVEDPVRGT
jgi:hypothetical protein